LVSFNSVKNYVDHKHSTWSQKFINFRQILSRESNALSTPGIIIILGSPNSEKGELYNTAIQRCDLGIREYKNHPDWRIMLTGGFGAHFNTARQPHTYYLKKYLLDRSIPSEAIIDQISSTSTLEDASLSKPAILKYNVTELLVITSDFHHARAQYIFEQDFANTNINIRFSLCKTDEKNCEFDLESQKAHETKTLKKLLLNR